MRKSIWLRLVSITAYACILSDTLSQQEDMSHSCRIKVLVAQQFIAFGCNYSENHVCVFQREEMIREGAN